MLSLPREVFIMSHEDKKDFNAMLHRDAGMPKVEWVSKNVLFSLK